MRQRLYWIDWAKVFALALMIIGHTGVTSDYEHKWIYSFHMPLFFICSGMLSSLAQRPNSIGDTKRACLKCVRTLLLPYFLLVAIIYAADWLLLGIAIDGKLLLGALGGTPGGRANAMWFVFAMFWIKLSDTIANAVSLRWALVAACLAVMTAYQISGTPFLPRAVTYPVAAYPFFYVGLRLRPYIAALSGKTLLGAMALGMASPFVAASCFADADIYKSLFCQNIAAYYTLGVMGTMMPLLACKKWLNKDNAVVVTLSKGSILVLAFHRLALYFIPYGDNVYLAHAASIALLIALYSPIKVMLRYAPTLAGGRK